MKKADTLHPPPFVHIVGAGPGDPDLLTVKAVRLLEKADCVVYDRLIPEEILAFIPERTERIYAGKSCRKHHMTQEQINQCLVDEAKKGKRIVRLKGGDPFIFGRGGEEAIALQLANIPYEIVPGVNAADGCAAYQGIPLTHRNLATSVRFITGHQQKGEPIPFDWPGLANEHTTLVIYMGLANLETITKNLIKHGLSKQTPAAIIQEGTTKNEKTAFTTLENLVKTAEAFTPPSIVVVGKVVELKERVEE